MKDIEIREVQICDYKKKIEESESKLKQQQNNCEAVIAEKNLYSKNLTEAKVGYVFPCASLSALAIFSDLILVVKRKARWVDGRSGFLIPVCFGEINVLGPWLFVWRVCIWTGNKNSQSPRGNISPSNHA